MSQVKKLSAREQLYFDTETDILRRIAGDVSREDIFWARVDIGMDYLVNLHGEWKASQIWKKKSFWSWFLQTWHVNDKKILHELNQHNVEKIEWYDYVDTQHARMLSWKVNEKVL